MSTTSIYSQDILPQSVSEISIKGVIQTDNNFYYDDGPNQGFNHLEIRRTKRLYTEGNAQKGDLAVPMQQTKQWIEDEVINNN